MRRSLKISDSFRKGTAMKRFNGFENGVNLGGWLSQCCHEKSHYDSFIGKEDIEKIASWGFDHVRLPIDYEVAEDKNGEPLTDGYKYIDNAVKWCEETGLKLVLDLHKTAGYSFDKGENENGFFESEELQQRFLRLWDRLSERYGRYSERIAFELLNEVTDKSYSDKWNELIYKCMERVRANAPDTTVIVGGYWNNSPDALPDIVKPYDDKTVLSFHCYDPMKFTHQGAEWVDDMDPSFRMSFDSSEITTNYFAGRFSNAIKTADKYDTALYCGEYGVIDRASPQDALAWYKAISEAFRKFGIARSVWNYKSKDFGISGKWLEPVIDELVKIFCR